MKLLSLLYILLISIALSACTSLIEGNTESVVSNLGGTRFYSLSSLPPATATNATLRIGVGPLQIPRLLNRPQIISRKNSNEINMAELHQWGGSYEEELMQVMTDNLSTLLKNNKEQLVKRALINTPIQGESYEAYVKAQSKALETLSQQIASKIRQLSSGH